MGRTGLRVSSICLGTMTFGFQTEEADSIKIMDTAWDAGVNFLDTSDAYPLGTNVTGGTEEIVGRWMKSKPRDQVILATKAFAPTGPGAHQRGLSRGHIVRAVDDSLRRLGTDYIDLYQSHFPDPETPIDETMKAFDDLVRWGKVRYVGCSNYQAWQLARALWVSDKEGISRFDCLQPRYNILFRELENETLPLCRDQGVGIIAYNPLAGGFLTGKYGGVHDLREGTRFRLGNVAERYQARYWEEAQFDQVAQLKTYFDGRGISLTHAAIAWVLGRSGITSAIVGASKPEQIADSLKAVDVQLTEEDLAACNEPWFNIPRRKDPLVALR